MYDMWKKVFGYCEIWDIFTKYYQICPRFARIISAKPCFGLQKQIPQNYLKTKLFNTDTDRMDAPKWIRIFNQKGWFEV